MKSSLKARSLARVQAKQIEARERVAFEMSRDKPENHSPLAARTTLRTWIVVLVRRIFRFFGRLFGWDRARGRVAKRAPSTPPREFGTHRTKLGRRLTRYAQGYHGSVCSRAERRYALRGYGYQKPE